MSGNWRIEELLELVARGLALAPPAGQSSGRVRDVPDIRMIRYYTTIGLIDRPAEMRGRTAFYGPKHLRQLVAVKRLQAQGKSLVEVQASLAGVGTKKLDQLAGLPAGFIESALVTNGETKREPRQNSRPEKTAAANPSPADRQRFWADVPTVSEVVGVDAGKADSLTERRSASAWQLSVMLPLDPGISLVLEGVAPEQLRDEVVATLQPAVAVLREALVRAGLSQRSQHAGAGQIDQQDKKEEGPR